MTSVTCTSLIAFALDGERIGYSTEAEQICFASSSRARGLSEPADAAGAACEDYEVKEVSIKKLEVGAGAKVAQKIYDDPNELDFWREKPESIIVINYACEDLVSSILKSGEIDVEGSAEGFMSSIPTGN